MYYNYFQIFVQFQVRLREGRGRFLGVNTLAFTIQSTYYLIIMKKEIILPILLFGICQIIMAQSPEQEPYNLNTDIRSRSISFENPTGEPGKGGTAASEIGVGRKGAPRRILEPGETVTLCDIKGSGTIRHLWVTGEFLNFDWLKYDERRNVLLRNIVIRAYWDGQEHPSIECPLGDLMGLAHSKITSYESAIHSIGERGALNLYLPMPFTKSARITFTNESEVMYPLYYQIDYTINEKHDEDVGRLHVLFRRENPTTKKQDFELLPKRTGKGRFIGAVIGIRTLYPGWWGEGEVKFYMDGDTDFPTIAGTGAEDYVGLSYGIQQTTFLNHGCNLNYKSDSVFQVPDYETGGPKDMSHEYISMYRWHLPDPIYWEGECRVTIQQIGCCYFERSDDWSTATFWYEPIPSEPLPGLPPVEQRVENLQDLFRISE